MTRFSELSPDLEKLKKKNRETEQRLAQTLKEADSLKARVGEAYKGLEGPKSSLPPPGRSWIR